MASLPGIDADVYFGDTEKPLPDWRAEVPENEDADADDDSPENRAGVSAILGFDPAEIEEESPEPPSTPKQGTMFQREDVPYHLREPEMYAEEGEWLTIGGKAEGDEKHVGGFRVQIDAEGRILKGGPAGLKGKKVSEVHDYFQKSEKSSSTAVDKAGAKADNTSGGETQVKPEEKKVATLKGSEKQIEWAEKLRAEFQNVEKTNPRAQDIHKFVLSVAPDGLNGIEDAKELIDNKAGLLTLAVAKKLGCSISDAESALHGVMAPWLSKQRLLASKGKPQETSVRIELDTIREGSAPAAKKLVELAGLTPRITRDGEPVE